MVMIQNLEDEPNKSKPEAVTFRNIRAFYNRSCKNLHPTPKLENHPCLLSMAAFQYFLRIRLFPSTAYI
jgi:hypothetical protein